MERHQPLQGVASRAERRRPDAAVPVKVHPSTDARTLGTRYDRRSGCTGQLPGLTGLRIVHGPGCLRRARMPSGEAGRFHVVAAEAIFATRHIHEILQEQRFARRIAVDVLE